MAEAAKLAAVIAPELIALKDLVPTLKKKASKLPGLEKAVLEMGREDVVQLRTDVASLQHRLRLAEEGLEATVAKASSDIEDQDAKIAQLADSLATDGADLKAATLIFSSFFSLTVAESDGRDFSCVLLRAADFVALGKWVQHKRSKTSWAPRTWSASRACGLEILQGSLGLKPCGRRRVSDLRTASRGLKCWRRPDLVRAET